MILVEFCIVWSYSVHSVLFSILLTVFLFDYLLLRRIVSGYHFQVILPRLSSPLSPSSPSSPLSPSSPSSPSSPLSPSSLILLLAAHLSHLSFSYVAAHDPAFLHYFLHRFHCLTLLLTSSYAPVFLLRNTLHPNLTLMISPLIPLLHAKYYFLLSNECTILVLPLYRYANSIHYEPPPALLCYYYFLPFLSTYCTILLLLS